MLNVDAATLAGRSPHKALGGSSNLPAASRMVEAAGKSVGGRLTDGRREPNREAVQPANVMRTLRQTALQDADPRSDYVKPEPATQALSPSRVVLTVIGIAASTVLD